MAECLTSPEVMRLSAEGSGPVNSFSNMHAKRPRDFFEAGDGAHAGGGVAGGAGAMNGRQIQDENAHDLMRGAGADEFGRAKRLHGRGVRVV